ncbi:MAG: aspartate aminotransferase family protein [Bradymonadales bacterium]
MNIEKESRAKSRSELLVDQLAKYECPAITGRRARLGEARVLDEDPIVFASASGSTITDVDGKRYLDMGACFAVCAYGHCHPELIQSLCDQANLLMHGMGDVYPTDTKIAFLRALAEYCPGDLSQSILSQSGAEAVESATKTAQIATGKSHFIAFENSYHGLSYGALSLTHHHRRFKEPFAKRIINDTAYFPYAYCLRCAYGKRPKDCDFACLNKIRQYIKTRDDVAAVIAEPIQGRGGDIVPPKGWLSRLREICSENSVLLILDEIYTGFGRTGENFACNHESVEPHILCMGKAMTGGFPLSAAIGAASLMAMWGANTGEAIHTSTFLGNPMACAMGLKSIELQKRLQIPAQAALKGAYLKEKLRAICHPYKNRIAEVRGQGLMLGFELVKNNESLEPDPASAWAIVQELRALGVILLPSGPAGQTVSLAPPLIIEEAELDEFCVKLESVLYKVLR